MSQVIESLLHPLKHYKPSKLEKRWERYGAVLIPILKEEPHYLLYTLRSQHLKKHAGQISFPGGGIDQGEHPYRAALREAHEEIGLPPEKVKVLGRIDDAFSPHGYHIRCYVGLVENFVPQLNPNEVDALIKVSLEELLDESRHEIKPWKGRDVHFFNFAEGLVWGVTGRITYQLRETLKHNREGATRNTLLDGSMVENPERDLDTEP